MSASASPAVAHGDKAAQVLLAQVVSETAGHISGRDVEPVGRVWSEPGQRRRQDLVASGAQPDGDLVPAPAALPATVDKQKSHRAPVFVRHHASMRCRDHEAKPARELCHGETVSPCHL